jgi:hypothetical protein
MLVDSTPVRCEYCDDLYTRNSSTQRFCGAKCRQAAHVERNFHRYHVPGITLGARGAIGELLICADLLARGYEVFRAVSQSCSCDLIAMRESVLLRVEEVKTVSLNVDGTPHKSSADPSKYDVLALLLPGPKIVYEGLPE